MLDTHPSDETAAAAEFEHDHSHPADGPCMDGCGPAPQVAPRRTFGWVEPGSGESDKSFVDAFWDDKGDGVYLTVQEDKWTHAQVWMPRAVFADMARTILGARLSLLMERAQKDA